MQKNYLLSNAESTTNLISTCEKRIQKNILTTCLLALFTLLGFSDVFGQTVIDYTVPGSTTTWTVPEGVTSVTVQCVGGGGAGGSGRGNNDQGAGGGAGGQYASSTIAVSAGQIYSIKVANTTNGPSGNYIDGSQGDFSSFFLGGTIHARAMGGNGGTAANIAGRAGGLGNTTNGIGNLFVRSGGNGGDGTAANSGGGGGGAGSTGNGGNATGTTAGTGTANFGGNGGAGRTTSGAGNPGFTYGGGGSGARRSDTGGNGSQGFVRITFTCPANTPSAGSNQTLAACATTATLAGSAVPTGMTGLWTVISGPATITVPSSPTSGVTGIVPGTPITLRWTVTNGACGSSFADVVITSPIGPGCLNYCTPTGNLDCTLDDYIANVTYNTLNNTTVCNAGGYTNFPAVGAQTTSVIKGSTHNFSLTVGAGTGTHGAGVWVDWNQDGDFVDAGEFFLVSNAIAPSSTTVIPITVPLTAATGSIRMRVRYAWNLTVTSAMSCTMAGTYGETEDYTITTIAPAPCTSPTAQPTALNLVPSGTNISGSFTAASPAADSYLVLISTNPAPPAAPVNGTTYPIGSVYQIGYNVVDNDSNTAFNATGLSTLTTYYFYIYSFNGLCSGGPLYLGTSPLTGNATTLTASYCAVSSTLSTRYIDDVLTVGNITNLSNLGTNRAATGYADYTALPPVTQIPGGGVTIDYRLAISRQFVKIWVDWNNDGTFTDAAPELVYTTGGVQTIAGAGGFVVPPATLPGNYRIRIRSYEASQTFGPCANLATGETEDYTLTVVADCAAKPSVLHDGDRCDVGTVVLGVEGTPGVTEFRFYDSLFGGTLIGTATAVPGITNWTTPALTSTTNYYVTAFNGICESWYRQEITATINPVANVVVTPSVPEVCGENNVVQIDAGGDFIIDYLVNEDFEGGGFGVLNRFNVAGQTSVDTQWTNRTGPYVPTGAVWKPAITSKAIGNMFAVANSDFAAPNPKDTQLRTVALNTTTFSDLFLSFRHYFSYYPGEPSQWAYVDVSTDGGTAWTTLRTYTSTQGYAMDFDEVTVDLSAYTGQTSVMVRFRYNLAGGSAWADGWAIDDVQVYGTRPLNTTFTWTGGTVAAFIDPACTIPYVAQTVTTVYVRPTAMQLASPSWSFTANATLGNGCPISEFITINNKTKLWKGTVDNNWYNANNWEPVGVPDANTCVFIYDGPFDSNINITGNDAYAYSLTVRPSGLLDIQPNNDLTVTNEVTVDAGGTFNIENNGSLIQVNNVANLGSINSKRIAVTNNILDYVYWSTPVAGFNVNSITPSSTNKYFWNPTVNNGGTYSGNFGNWVAASGAMTTGRGYIVRGSSGNTTFAGVPNNGNITIPITRGTYTLLANYTGPTATPVTRDDDNWNLLGNPYPSALSADAFLTANLANLSPFVKIWRHGIDPATISDPFYQDYQLNYNTSDYLTYNRLGGTQSGFDGYIGSGQGFFVLMTDAGATTENAVFNNTMRSNAFRNNQFYRTGEGIERHRIWLKIISPTRASNDMLVGYTSEATNEFDSIFDTKYVGVKTNFELYSLIDSDGYIIQGRALPFNNNDEIPLGVSVPQNGIYVIAIDAVDGLFNSTSQEIFIEDKTLGTTHNLRSSPYSFTANTGRFDNRFVLKFKNETLSSEDFTANSIMVYANESINVVANNQTIKSVRVHDLLGRVLGTFNNVNSSTFDTKNIAKTQSALLVEVTLDNGLTKTYKVIF